ncbi:MAG: type IV pilus twitching motility protein PilT [Meiothermus sp.]|uniref:type IV pilus twitching motility protein PilT n=1 Tax=Meiothermus sp. TaxID=1955249 RepID=UPI0025F58DFF|nr:type IV pilus twitching motility protein PilT [Meiothermus sp.]MCS7059134.1 type IV pilus twitching motility protein PilT [Meiothermus sp.]MCS7195494.1 type IV pilus twitching motility protein PilT [Meiothermus sp.]MDW8090422.1 type IV pilus twitching motility protein PilT [Meiothermus sp.]MDW8481077.1 type IV pilus twitching motility protein PilT [Meiothermus sp.]
MGTLQTPTPIAELLRSMVEARASDIHLQAGAPPTVRIDGKLKPFTGKPLSPADVEQIVRSLLSPLQLEELEYKKEMDFAYTIPGLARFRCNLLHQRGSLGLVMRVVSENIPSFEALGLPRPVMEGLASKERGLVLVTGPTGSGKSTTLAALIDHINLNYPKNIITIEDPIEFLHRHKKSLVVQREVGVDTDSFASGLKYAMRQDPDVILIGEMRDRETVEAAIMAAQTGHLVLSTLHTLDAIRTINRIIDFFPLHEHLQIRILLAESLLGILSQRLLPRADGQGRVLALEILLATPFVRDLIKDENKTPQIKDAMMQDNLRGMQTFDQHLVELYTQGLISLEDAEASATSPHEFKLMLTKATGRGY